MLRNVYLTYIIYLYNDTGSTVEEGNISAIGTIKDNYLGLIGEP